VIRTREEIELVRATAICLHGGFAFSFPVAARAGRIGSKCGGAELEAGFSRASDPKHYFQLQHHNLSRLGIVLGA
jgi:hypothetical protein